MIMVLSLPSTCNQLKKNVIFYQKFHKNYITDNILSRKSVQTLVWLSNWTLSAFRVLFTPIFVICYKFSPTCFSEKEINCWLCSQYRKWFFILDLTFANRGLSFLHKRKCTYTNRSQQFLLCIKGTILGHWHGFFFAITVRVITMSTSVIIHDVKSRRLEPW